MKLFNTIARRVVLAVSTAWLAIGATPAQAQAPAPGSVRIAEVSGIVEVLPRGATNWVRTQAGQELFPLDLVRTRANSSLALLLPDQSVVRFDAMSELEIQPEPQASEQGLHLIDGLMSFFHRGKPGRIHVISSGGLAGIEGTEFVMGVRRTGAVEQTTLWVIDGRVSFSNAGSGLTLTNGDQAIGEPGQAPRRAPGFIVNNVLQWCFYYPGVLDLKDLALPPATASLLAASLTNYAAGDLRSALAGYPAGRVPDSDAERVYHAALLLEAGQVSPAEGELAVLAGTGLSETNGRLAAALRQLIAAVKREPSPEMLKPTLATEWLAESYYVQGRGGPKALEEALKLARQAVAHSPGFGFGWERVAELEFSFGRTGRAREALDRALTLSPRNAQALALKGFLLAARNQPARAIEQFDRALAADGALGNAWLGRGLCRIHQGDSQGGREDLLVAAAMEPERAVLRSYLGKAQGDAGETRRAFHEFGLAKQMDTNDPTAWLYSALLNEENNRINEAVRDLEQSQELNDNRSVYRSRLLLDQDRAVRSANLARIYEEAGMEDVAVREAVRAVDADYANYSAHLFLANSYNALRDPNQINLRYETPTEVEYLLGNLLSPAGAGVLSPAISQQEYSRLFDRNRFGVVSETEYLSRGAWTESGAQYGTTENFSYDLEAYYRWDPGQRPNNDVEQRQLSLTIKQQLTPQDTLIGMVSQYEGTGGDLRQYYNQTNADLGLRTRETQEPLVTLGLNHEWAPGAHTLLLAGRLQDTYEVQDTQSPVEAFSRFTATGPFRGVGSTTANQDYQSDTVLYTAEVQQIFQAHENAWISGLRYQGGTIDTRNFLNHPQRFLYFPGPPYQLDQNYDERMERLSAYSYYLWQALDSVQLTGGVTYDWETYPEDFRLSPIAAGRQTEGQVSPKAGVIWTPFQDTVFRAAYTRSLGGASFEQSYQLEPSQVAGFNQLFRSLIPESVQGENAGARFETWGGAFEQKIGRDTFFALSGQILDSQVDRQTGVMVVGPSTYASTTPEHLNYQERDIQATVDQLLGKYWTVGLQYHLTDVRLQDQLLRIPQKLVPTQDNNALLHQFEAHARFNHPTGFFAEFEALWNDQRNAGYAVAEPGDEFWQFNVFAGYRSPRKHAEVTVGVLNLGGRDYQLNPLTSVAELPRERTLVVRLKLDF